jgi:hypothetical protein
MKKRKLRKKLKRFKRKLREMRELERLRYEDRNRCPGGIVQQIGQPCSLCGAGLRDECPGREVVAA